MLDKRGLLPDLHGAVLDLGCGTWKTPGVVGVDLLDSEEVDLVGDVYEVLAAVKPGSVSQITSSHFFEHVDDVTGLLELCHRVLTVDGTMTVTVPHFSNPYFYSDPTHRATFGLYSFSYLAECSLFERRVPTYQQETHFEVIDAELRFRTDTGAFARRWRGMGRIQRWVNKSRRRQEFYEERLVWLLPCYEVMFTLQPR